VSRDRLRALDTAFLDIERPGLPIHIGGIAVFEGGPLFDGDRFRIDELRAVAESRLHLMPRLRRRLARVPGDAARPEWVDDPTFDLANHIRVMEAPAPGDDAALVAVAEALHVELLDRSRPLWDICFVTGLEGERVAAIERAHHALIDGVAGVDVSLLMLDLDPTAVSPPAPPFVPEPEPEPMNRLLAGLRDQLAAPIGLMTGALGSLRNPRRLATDLGEVVSALASLRREGVVAPRSSLNRAVGDRRRLIFVRCRLEEVKSAGAASGATANDVVLAAVTGGLRRLLAERDEPLPANGSLTALVPVSRRGSDEHQDLGNRVSALFVPLPVGIGDGDRRLRTIAATTAELKHGTEAQIGERLLGATDLLPRPIAVRVARSLDHQPFVNLVVTNVPGVACPLYALGGRMIEARPIVSLGANMPLEVAVLSYDGALTLGITADRTACPDVDVFVAGLERTLAELGARQPVGRAAA
jgi:WS/DGAT/MGAT family acyltransferase